MNYTTCDIFIFGFFHLTCNFVLPCTIKYISIILFYIWITIHCMNMPYFVYPFINWYTFGLFLLLALKIWEQTLLFLLILSLSTNWISLDVTSNSLILKPVELFGKFSFQLLYFSMTDLYFSSFKKVNFIFTDIFSLVKHNFHTSLGFFRHDFI